MHKRVVDFIKKQYLFTLACTENNLPWANAFYYIFDEKENRLIYITGDQTHHAKVIRNNSRVAGTIFVPTRFVPSLQGVQFTGRSSQLFSTQAEKARALYKTEYSHHLIDQLTVWQVELEYVRLVDNSLGLFSTIEWRKGQMAENADHYV